MAVKLIANYAKRLGLPAYSSHQYSISVEAELSNLDDVAGESQRLYQLLQESVDAQIQDPGFVPGDGYATDSPAKQNGSGSNGTGHAKCAWQCSEKQWQFMQGILTDHRLSEEEVDELANQRFGCGVRRLNRLQMSGLLDELLERYGDSSKAYRQHRQNGNGGRRQYSPARNSR